MVSFSGLAAAVGRLDTTTTVRNRGSRSADLRVCLASRQESWLSAWTFRTLAQPEPNGVRRSSGTATYASDASRGSPRHPNLRRSLRPRRPHSG